ncbi:MAG: hypothetical protein KGM17_10230 [Sphingomonadales bacterium]|nr:hypothetical protein [Sphingomonadales bacterium]
MHVIFDTIVQFVQSIVHPRHEAGFSAAGMPHAASAVLSREELRREVLGVLG